MLLSYLFLSWVAPHPLCFWSTNDEYMLLMKLGFKITHLMLNQNSLFYWEPLSVSSSDNHQNTDITLPCGHAPSGRVCCVFLESFWPFFTSCCPPLEFRRSRASSIFAGLLQRVFWWVCRSQESGERGRCFVVQLICLALRLAWPTNYLSKGHSQALWIL